MAIDLTKYYRSDLIRVKEAEVGGRPYSAVFNADLPNGILGGLGSGVFSKAAYESLIVSGVISIVTFS